VTAAATDTAGLTIYGYRDAVSGFFEFPTENAREILPAHLEPVEVHHGTSIFSMTAFDFDESMVGEYGEIVMSVICSPLVKPGERLPKSAFYPYLVATTTRSAREHAIERWRLPHYMEDIRLEFEREPLRTIARVSDTAGAAIAELTICAHGFAPVNHLYQAFTCDLDGGDSRYLANIIMEGEQSEHEDEKGSIVLHDHAFNRALSIDDVYATPFRELWMRRGRQTFDPLKRI
jgi:hypothetical protein